MTTGCHEPLPATHCAACTAHAVDAVKAARGKAEGDLAVDLDLLLGRVYSQWKGHDAEALAIYDRLAEVRAHGKGPAMVTPASRCSCLVCDSTGGV